MLKQTWKPSIRKLSIRKQAFIMWAIVSLASTSSISFDWQADNHQLLMGDYGNNGSLDWYLQPANVATQVEIPYNITLNLATQSPFSDTVLETSGGSVFLNYGADSTTLGQSNWSNASHPRHYGDFNGDGYQDLLIQPTQTNSTGVIVLGFAPGDAPSIWHVLNTSALGVDIANATLQISDVNQDGLDDVIIQRSGQADRVALAYSDVTQGSTTLSRSLPYPLCSDDGGLTDSDCDGAADRYDLAQFQANNNNRIEDSLSAASIGPIPGDFSVSSSGKARYQIPLTLVPGAGNSKPQLALSYDQQAGNGIVGVGWYIQGLSDITRCPTTLDQDGFINGVNFNSSDRYCLNGQRLISIGANEYRTENETFTKIIANGSVGNGPASFTVRKASGEIETYGGTSNAQRFEQSGQHIYTWAISRSEDREGNFSTYHYNNVTAEGKLWISRIDYNGNSASGKSPNASVRFAYQNRSDITPSQRDSIETRLSQRLQHVRTYLNNNLVRRYQLSYTNGKSGRSLVNSIQECLGEGSSCLSPTQFSWDKGLATESEFNLAEDASHTGFLAAGYSNHQYHTGDVNGDGKADVVWTYRDGNTLGRVLFLANADGTGFTQREPESETGYSAGTIANDSQRYLMADINGDGKSDLLWVARFDDTFVRHIYLANSSGTGFVSQGYEIEARPEYSEFNQGRYHLVDINGDGLADLLWSYQYQNRMAINVYLAQFSASGQIYLGKVSQWSDQDYTPSFYQNQQFVSGDVNGDGKHDLVWVFSFQNTIYRVLYLANASGDGYIKISLGSDVFATNEKDHQFQLGDINNDGKADLIWTRNSGNQLKRTLYQVSRLGTSFVKKETETDTLLNLIGHNATRTRLSDLNGDGRQDLIYSYVDGTNFGWVTYLADMDGEGFSRHSNGSEAIESGSQNHEYRFADVNGDGKSDLIMTYNTSTGTLRRRTFTQAQSYPDHIERITDGFNNTIDIDYAYLADSSIYTPGSAVNYPLRNDSGLSYVVARVERSNGIGGMNRWDYRYQGARTHLRGRGFLGFAQRTVIDHQRNFTTVETYHQSFPFIGELISSTTRQGNHTIEEINNDWQQTAINNGANVHRYLHRQGVIKRNLTSGQETFASVVTNTYNHTYGHLDQTVTRTGRGYNNFAISNLDQTVTTDYDYAIDTASWRIRFVNRETKTYVVPGEAARTIVHAFTPYSSSSLLSRTETEFVGTAIEQTRSFERDAYGNILSATVTGRDIDNGNITPQTESVNQYLNGLYADISTNAEGHQENHVFDHRYGSIKQHRDVNGLYTDTLYDGYGHLLFERHSDGTEIQYDYALCGACPSQAVHALYSATQTTTHKQASGQGAPTQVNYFDSFDRVVATRTTQDDGAYIWTQTQYDSLGRVDRKSQPHTGSSASHWIDYQYDSLDRVTLETRPDGGSTQTEYLYNSTYPNHSRMTAVVNVPNGANLTLVSHLYQNTLGQLLRSVDANNTQTNYDYDSQGHLREVVVDNNTATRVTVETDVAGNRIVLDDPAFGFVSFEYDAVKRERRRTFGSGANQHSITSVYDRLNRVVSRTDSDGNTTQVATWSYDPSNGIGNIGQASATDYQKNYHYDELARVQRTEISLLGEAQPKVFHYTYDPYSRPLQVSYPSGLAITHEYNSRGYHHKTLNAQTQALYWEAQARDVFGNVTREQFGNGATTVRNYDMAMGRIADITTGSSSAANQFQQLSYLHDSAGNLVQRRSTRGGLENLVESFVYDNLHRLINATTSGLASGSRSIDYAYNNLGNITYKSDVGDYRYDSARPHAVTDTTPREGGSAGNAGSSFQYDFKGNMTTRGNQTLVYSVFNKPIRITGSTPPMDGGSAGYAGSSFQYGPDRQRFYQRSDNNGVVTDTRYYDKAYELVQRGTRQREKTAIGDYLVITRVTDSASPAIAEDIDYLHRDHLGSVEAITDRFGSFTGRFAFDPWGQRRQDAWGNTDANDSAAIDERTFESTTRGFTNHEHLDAVGLIHMNGRVYDPLMGRFLSPDDYVQFPEYSQSYNRYTYVLNNPLSYTDPSGEFISLIIGAVVLAVKAYDAYTTAKDVHQTITDDNLSTGEKSLELVTQVGMAAIPAPKFITKYFGKLFSSKKPPKPPAKNKPTGNQKSQDGAGSDRNTEKKAENRDDSKSVGDVPEEGVDVTKKAEAARDALANEKKRKHATYAGGHKDGKTVAGCSSNPTGCAEDDIARQLGSDAQMTSAKGFRRNKATGELEYTDIPVCTRCQSKYDKSQFPSDVKYDKGGAWD